MKSEHGRQKGFQSGSGKSKAEQPTPSKQKGGDVSGKDPRKAACDNREPLKDDHICTRCKKWSPFVKFTHDTKDCQRWDTDGIRLSLKANANRQRSNHYTKMQKKRAK